MGFDNLPLYGTFDVVVAGGGTAGFAAAASAAEAGARTLVIEEKAYLGGTSTGGMISQFMGFRDDERNETQEGVFGETLRRLIEEGASDGIRTIHLSGRRDMGVSAAPYDSEVLKLVMDRMAAEAGAEVLLHTRVVSLAMDGDAPDAISHLVIHNIQGLQRVQAKVYVDATFHGSIAAEAGCAWTIGDEDGAIQPGTLVYKTAGVDADAYAALSGHERKALARRGVASGKMLFDSIIARPLPDGTIYASMGRVHVNPLDARSLSEAERAGREQVRSIASFFAEEVPGFGRSRVVAAGDFLGLRDSRRILGQYVLTKDDIVEGTEFPDSVASSSYPIDIHNMDTETSTLVKPARGVYHIPFRCMVGNVRNLVTAGRCISADYHAHACIRVMVTCMRIGEAAGIAAAESAAQGVDVNRLDGSLIRRIRRIRRGKGNSFTF